MSKLGNLIEPFDRILWKSKPDRKAYLLISCLSGIPIVLAFISGALFFYFLGVPKTEILLIVVGGFAFYVLIINPIYYIKKYSKIDYILTKQRLIIRSEYGIKSTLFKKFFDLIVLGERTWFAELRDIKELIVKKGWFWDKILGTASFYFITPDYPYPVKLYAFENDFPWSKRSVYNVITEKKEKVSNWNFWKKTYNRPRMEAIKKPNEIEKLIREAIKSTYKIP